MYHRCCQHCRILRICAGGYVLLLSSHPEAHPLITLLGLNTGAAGPHMWNVRILLLTDKYFDVSSTNLELILSSSLMVVAVATMGLNTHLRCPTNRPTIAFRTNPTHLWIAQHREIPILRRHRNQLYNLPSHVCIDSRILRTQARRIFHDVYRRAEMPGCRHNGHYRPSWP